MRGKSRAIVALCAAWLFGGGPELYCRQNLQNLSSGDALNPLIQQMVGQVRRDSLLNIIKKLENFGTRYEYTLQRDSAATYIINSFKKWGLQVESDVYSYSQANFMSLDMVDGSNGWIIGEDIRDQQSFLLRTTNGGKAWSFLSPPGTAFLEAMDFTDSRIGWIVGSGGEIFKTSDAGVSWITQSSPTRNSLFDVRFASAQLGIAVGDGGTIVRTSDGGSTWSVVSSGAMQALAKCEVLTGQRMWVVGFEGTILHSSDAGLTWVRQNSGVTSELASVDFVDSLTGWVVGSMATVLRTTDGGITWMKSSLPPNARRDPDISQDVYALSSSSVMVLTGGDVWKSDDAGVTWKRNANLGTQRLRRLPDSSFVTYGDPSGIYRSTDRGVTWSEWDQTIPRILYSTSRNCVATIPGSMTPEKEYVLVAHYDTQLGDDPGANDNASGVGAILEAARILKSLEFESTIRIVAVSGGGAGRLGSAHYARHAKAQGRDVRLVVNVDMIGYPVTSDTTRIVVSSFERRSPFLDSALTYNARYGLGMKVDGYVDSVGEGDAYSFAVGGYETLHLSEGTTEEIVRSDPFWLKPTDTSNRLHLGMIQRATQYALAIIGEFVHPVGAPRQPWTWQSPYGRLQSLRSLALIDQKTMVAVGDFGTIVKTTDGGQTWKSQSYGSSIYLKAVWFTSASSGIVVGDNGTVLRTSNGGTTWSAQTIDPRISLSGLYFTDANTGMAVGYPGAAYRTTDGGRTWTQKVVSPAISLTAVSFVQDTHIGFLVGSSGSIYRTTDAGVTWTRQVSGLEGVDAPTLRGVSFADANTGSVVGDFGIILRTVDGGVTWTRQVSGTKYHLNAVCLKDSENGTAVGEVGLILQTTDGGKTWQERSYGLTSWLSFVTFLGPSLGMVVGSDGMILRTDDGGTSWAFQVGGPRVPLYGTRFAEATRGFAVGYKGAIYSTTDEGATWRSHLSGTTNNLRAIEFPDRDIGIVVGEHGTILRSTNGGLSWVDQSIPPAGLGSIYTFWSVAFSGPTTGLIVGRFDRQLSPTYVRVETAILRTTDGGVTWVRINTPWQRELFGVSFGGTSTATAVGDTGTVLKSTDAGKTWAVQSGFGDPEAGIVPLTTMRLNSVSCFGPDRATAVGDLGTIVRTTDGGNTWALCESGTTNRLESIWVVNGVHGLAVGTRGTGVLTADGGASWKATQLLVVNDLHAVHFTDPDRGTIVGDAGLVLRTARIPVTSNIDDDRSLQLPSDFSLSQNYPNPFNSSTTITYRLPFADSGGGGPASATLEVFDILGRRVATLVNGVLPAGTHSVRWIANNVPSGVYFYRLQLDQFVDTKKMILLK
jgi:photosystem II stability/assembly factor-like uncharacterized protein